MLLLDVNVLLAAHRQDHPHHASVRLWLDEVIDADEDFGVPAGVWASFLRLATNRRVFAVPTPVADAFDFVDALAQQHRYLPLEPGPRHVALLRRLCEESGAAGDLIPDAVLGAVAIEHGATVATLDRDFARFTSVDHLRPGEGPA